jgi:hypothetical protein
VNTPRYRVGTVTGYALSKTSGKPVTVWYIHDSAYCYRIVKAFRQINPEQRARDYADQLNLELPPPPDACRHGHERTPWNTYVNAKTGYRSCKVCAYDSDARRRRARQAGPA